MANKDLKKVGTGITRLAAWVWIGLSGLLATVMGVFGSDSGNAAKWEIELVMLFMFILFSAPGWY